MTTNLELVRSEPLPDFRSQLVALQPLLFSLASKLCGRPDDARDLVQDTFERALRAGRSPNPNLQAWLISILQHRFIDIWRKRASSKQSTSLEDVPAETSVAATETEEAPRWASLDSSQVRAAVERLHENHREIFVLHAIEGLPYADVAQRLRIPKNTVGTRLYRARQQLRVILEGELARAPATGGELSLVQRRARVSRAPHLSESANANCG